MQKKYVIKSIKHNGRKGIRDTEVTNPKYRDMIGAKIWADFSSMKQFESFTWDFEHHPLYRWWTTSEILAAAFDHEKKLMIIETANTIYELEEVQNDGN